MVERRSNGVLFEIKGRVSSKKNSRRIGKVRGRILNFPSKSYSLFHKSAIGQIGSYVKPIKGPYEAHYLFEMKGKASTDIDNMIASINDILQDCGYIDDDKNILKVRAEKRQKSPEYVTQVKIISLAS